MEEGTGKTLTYLEIVSKLDINSLLIICPKSLLLMWKRVMDKEAERYGITNFRVESYDRAARHNRELQESGYQAIVLDESSKIKRHKSQRTKGILHLSRFGDFELRLMGTGTPFGNSFGYELFSYTQFLFGAASPYGTSFHKFREEFYEEVFDFEWEPRDGTLDVFSREITKWSFRIRKADAFDLPPLLFKRHTLRKLKAPSSGIYKAMREEAVALHGTRKVATNMKAVRLNKMQQLCAGVLYSESTEPWERELLKKHSVKFTGKLDNPKMEWLKENLPEILAEKSGDVLIVATFTRALAEICNWLQREGIPFGAYFGASRCDLDGNYRVLVANSTTIAFGHNLQRLSHIIFFTHPWKWEERKQTIGRAHRGGQDKKVTVHDLEIENSIDTYILEALDLHKDVSRTILRDVGVEF